MGKLFRMSWRNVWRNWRRTVIAVIAIALGLAFLIFFDGMMSGSAQDDLRQRCQADGRQHPGARPRLPRKGPPHAAFAAG